MTWVASMLLLSVVIMSVIGAKVWPSLLMFCLLVSQFSHFVLLGFVVVGFGGRSCPVRASVKLFDRVVLLVLQCFGVMSPFFSRVGARYAAGMMFSGGDCVSMSPLVILARGSGSSSSLCQLWI